MSPRKVRPEPLYTTLGAYMKGVRNSRNETQAVVAVRMGISDTVLSYYETGRHRVPTDMFIRWCDVFGLDTSETLTIVQTSVARQQRGAR